MNETEFFLEYSKSFEFKELISHSQRYGQSLFNFAYSLNPEATCKATDIAGDPFYNDDLSTKFVMEFLKEFNRRA